MNTEPRVSVTADNWTGWLGVALLVVVIVGGAWAYARDGARWWLFALGMSGFAALLVVTTLAAGER
jgi:hypothetical protein